MGDTVMYMIFWLPIAIFFAWEIHRLVEYITKERDG